MTPLAFAGALSPHLRQTLRDHGLELSELALDSTLDDHTVVLAVGSTAVAALLRSHPKALVVAVCDEGDWPAAVRAGADLVVPADGDLVRGALERARATAAERLALGAFRRAEALTVPGSKLAALEQAAILAAMRACHGSTARAAAMLDISVRKVQYKLHEYGMPPTRKRSESEARWGAPPNGRSRGDEEREIAVEDQN